MFDFLYDLELDTTAVTITAGIGALIGFFLFADPLGMGMASVPFGPRLIGWVGGLIMGYFIALRMLN